MVGKQEYEKVKYNMNDASGKVILFLGGARSGKSTLAENMASSHETVAYVATAEAFDDEMRERINKHRESRPSSWVTLEVDGFLNDALLKAFEHAGAVIVDCLTIYVARCMDRTVDDEEIIAELVDTVKAAKTSGKTVVFVSNEVGMGLVPEYPVGRRYRDLLGIVNQKTAELADTVLFTIAGIPVDIKALRYDG